MTSTLNLTKKEVESFINGNLPERFEEIFDDIPMYHPDHIIEKGETHRDYSEDDGRTYNWFIFKDTKTDIEYCINYIYHPEWPNDLMDVPASIKIVSTPEESDLYVKPEPVIVPEVVLTPEQKTDKELWAEYQAVAAECKVVEKKEKLKVPKATIDDILAFLKSEKFNMNQLRAKVIPVCIEYKLEEKSFWQWLQVKRGSWK